MDQETAISPLEIRTGDGDCVAIRNGLTESMIARKFAGFNSMSSIGDFGSMAFHHFPGNGFAIWYSEYEITRVLDFLSMGNFAVLELSIPLVAKIYSGWDGMEIEFVRDEQFDLSYVPFLNNRTSFRKVGGCRTFDIHYSREYLDRFAGIYPSIGHFLEKVDRKEPVSLTGRNRVISPAMKKLVLDMLSFNLSENLAGFYYEGSALLMLTLVMDRLNDSGRKSIIKYSDHEKDCVEETKNILLSDLSEKYSIRELARMTGTSETKLQLTFKHIQGTTIFDFAQTAKLDFARTLLLETDGTIQSIAERCGYPDNSNLTAAFKKKFGYSPEAFRLKAR